MTDLLFDTFVSTFDIFAATSAIETETAIENGANINAVNDDGLSVFALAAFDRNLEKMTVLLNHDVNVNVNDVDKEGLTPLLSIFLYENQPDEYTENDIEQLISLLKLLVTYGADINQRYPETDYSTDCQTILFHCSHPTLMMAMLEHGADVYVVDGDGNTVLDNLKRGLLGDYEYGEQLYEILVAAGAVDSDDDDNNFLN